MSLRSRLPVNGLVAGALAFAGLTLVEMAWVPGGPSPAGTGGALLLGTLVGGAAGLLWRLPPRIARIVGAVVGLAAGLWLASALGAWARIGTKDAALAWAVVVAGPLGGLAVGAGLAWAPRWFDRDARAMTMVAFTLAGVCIAADALLFPTTYGPFHTALQLTALVAVMVPLRAWLGPPLAPWRAGGLVVAGLVLLVLDAASDDPVERARALDRPFAGLAIDGIRTLSDVDADGYGVLVGGGDCAPFDGSIHPGAPEVPGNGIDDNCLGGDGEAAVAVDPATVPVPSTSAPVSVVLLTVDALRPDRMGIYGHDRPTTPQIDAFFADGARHEATYTSGGFTSIAVPSMMRGMRPRRIRWTPVVQTNRLRLFRRDQAPPLVAGEQTVYTYGLPLDDPHRPLAWWLRRRGMTTAAVVDDGPSKFLEARWGTGEGFDRFVEVSDTRDGDDVTAESSLAVLDAIGGGAPFFFWAHFYGPHLPDQKHEGTPLFGNDPLARYDHEIAFADAQVGKVLAALEALERPLVVFLTSDHGEMVWGPGRMRSHGRIIHPHAVRVPLLVRGLGGAPTPALDPGVRGTVDLMPTIMALTATPMPADRDGVDLRQPRGRPVITETWFWNADGSPGLDMVAAIDAEDIMVVDRLRNIAAVYGRTDTGLPPKNRAAERTPEHLIEEIAHHIELSGGPPRLVEGR